MQGSRFCARDLLRAQVLLHRDREIGAALHRGVVGDDDALAPGDTADAGDDAGGGHLVAVQAVGGELRQFEERRAGIDQRRDPVARQQLAARDDGVAARFRRRPAPTSATLARRSATRPASLRRWQRTRPSAGRCPNGVASWANPPPLAAGRGLGNGAVHSPNPLPQGEGDSLRITRSRGTVRARSACGGFRWCRRRSRTAWRRAAAGRSDSR